MVERWNNDGRTVEQWMIVEQWNRGRMMVEQ